MLGERTSFSSNNTLLLQTWLFHRNIAKPREIGEYILNSHIKYFYVYMYKHIDITYMYVYLFIYNCTYITVVKQILRFKHEDLTKIDESMRDAFKEHLTDFWSQMKRETQRELQDF